MENRPPEKKALFLDRDGIINRPPPPEIRYILEPEAFSLMPGIAETIRICNLSHIPVVVVTNQKCIALGKLTLEGLQQIHGHMEQLLKAEDARVDAVYFCPHSESDACSCRKPLPGMILQAAADLHLSTKRSWLVGDQPRDIEAGLAAGCRTLHISPNPTPRAEAHLSATLELPEWIKTHFLKNEVCHTGFDTL